MAVTLADLIDEIESFVYSYFNDRDKVTTLSSAINEADLTLTVAEAELIDRGYIEIDSELIAVKTKNTSTGQVTVHPWGRGERGTAAASHGANSKVTVNPRFPRSWIKTEIGIALANLYPDLFAVATDTANTAVATQLTYPVPAAVESVISVAVDTVGPSKLWQPLKRWRFDFSADTTEFPTGRTITVLDALTPGQKLQVVYRKQFGTLSADADLLSSTGCDESWRDLIKLQVAARMIMALDSARLQNTSIEASNRANQVPVGSAAQISRQLLAMYAQRLEQERRLLLARYPTVPTIR